jgi:hypothetical protein
VAHEIGRRRGLENGAAALSFGDGDAKLEAAVMLFCRAIPGVSRRIRERKEGVNGEEEWGNRGATFRQVVLALEGVGEREHGNGIVGAAVLRKEMKLTGGGHLSARKRLSSNIHKSCRNCILLFYTSKNHKFVVFGVL